jgi:hypothetical protein
MRDSLALDTSATPVVDVLVYNIYHRVFKSGKVSISTGIDRNFLINLTLRSVCGYGDITLMWVFFQQPLLRWASRIVQVTQNSPMAPLTLLWVNKNARSKTLSRTEGDETTSISPYVQEYVLRIPPILPQNS